MTRNEILDNKSLLKRFCRDYNVPVSTYCGYYFEKQLETLSLHDMKYKNKFEEFCDELKNFEDADSYFAYYNDLKDRVITYIQNHPAFKTFSESKFEPQGKWDKKELYCEENDGKIFISVDMRQANFNIMKLQAFDIFYDYDRSVAHTWESFLASFGASPYLQGSKYLRQVIFGACNPKKQIQAQTEQMTLLANEFDKGGNKIYSVVTDEIIFDSSCYYPHIVSFMEDAELGNKDFYHITAFMLIKVGEIGYIKKILYDSDDIRNTGKNIIKCVDSDFMCQFIKCMYAEKIEDHDLVFDYKGKLASFDSPINNPFA